jgi:hypothetical protein
MPRVRGLRADKYTLQPKTLKFILTISRENCGLLDALVPPETRYALMNHPLFSTELRAVPMALMVHNTSVVWQLVPILCRVLSNVNMRASLGKALIRDMLRPFHVGPRDVQISNLITLRMLWMH